MTIKDAQAQVDHWIKTHGVRYFNELTNMAMLAEEVGEVARIMARTYGEQSEKKSDSRQVLSDELADVLFVLICIANQTNVDLTKALEANLAKKTKRDGKRHSSNKKWNHESYFIIHPIHACCNCFSDMLRKQVPFRQALRLQKQMAFI